MRGRTILSGVTVWASAGLAAIEEAIMKNDRMGDFLFIFIRRVTINSACWGAASVFLDSPMPLRVVNPFKVLCVAFFLKVALTPGFLSSSKLSGEDDRRLFVLDSWLLRTKPVKLECTFRKRRRIAKGGPRNTASETKN